MDKLRGQAQEIQELSGAAELPELEESVSAIEGRMIDAEQKHQKLKHELDQIRGNDILGFAIRCADTCGKDQ